MIRKLTLASLVTVAMAGTAAAEPAAITDFTTLDRFGGQTGAAADMSIVIAAGDSDVDGIVTRFDLWAEYQAPQGFGAYLHLPVSRAFFGDSDDPLVQMLIVDEANGATYLGSLELGGSYALPLGQDQILARVGLVLPTADDSFGGFLTNAVAMGARLTDMALISPDTTWIRASASPTVRRGRFFARVDAGLDIAVHQGEDDDPNTMTETPDPMVRLNLGAGAEVAPRISLMGELATIGTTGDVEDDDDRFLHTAAITAAYRAERVQPSLSLSTILDDSGRGDGYTVAAGVRGNF